MHTGALGTVIADPSAGACTNTGVCIALAVRRTRAGAVAISRTYLHGTAAVGPGESRIAVADTSAEGGIEFYAGAMEGAVVWAEGIGAINSKPILIALAAAVHAGTMAIAVAIARADADKEIHAAVSPGEVFGAPAEAIRSVANA